MRDVERWMSLSSYDIYHEMTVIHLYGVPISDPKQGDILCKCYM